MIYRRTNRAVRNALLRSPSLVLMGPRQVGKTTIALDISKSTPSVYLDLESWSDLEKVGDIVSFHQENRERLIILDEVQRLPEVFASLRGIIDKERRKGKKAGQFLFLGPSCMNLLKQSSESLAGRISYLALFPIDALEYGAHTTEQAQTIWLRGGFPESLLAESDLDSMQWRRDFIKTYLERYIPQLGPRIPAQTLERFWTMLARHQGTVLNAAHFARNLDVSGVTIARYLDLMVDLLLVRRLMPWTFNIGKRLVRSPKIYVRDSGITHALLNIRDFNHLLGHPVIGGSWEGFVIENIMSVAPSWVKPFYYGTPGGSEIDLILEFSPIERWAIDIRRSASPSLSKGFHLACETVQPQKKFVIYGGRDRFLLTEDIEATSLYDFLQEIGRLGE